MTSERSIRKRVTVGGVGILAATALVLTGCGTGTPDKVVSAADNGTSHSTAGDTPGDMTTPQSDAAPTDRSSPDPAQDTAKSRQSSVSSHESGETAPETDNAPTSRKSSGVLSELAVTPEQAAEAALAAHADAQVVEVSLDRAKGVTVWEVTVVSDSGRWEVDIDAVTGDTVRDRTDDPEDRAKDLDRLSQARVDYAQAIAAALKSHPDGSLVEIELDREHGTVIWEADVIDADHTKFEIEIDAVTGDVILDEVDD